MRILIAAGICMSAPFFIQAMQEPERKVLTKEEEKAVLTWWNKNQVQSIGEKVCNNGSESFKVRLRSNSTVMIYHDCVQQTYSGVRQFRNRRASYIPNDTAREWFENCISMHRPSKAHCCSVQ